MDWLGRRDYCTALLYWSSQLTLIQHSQGNNGCLLYICWYFKGMLIAKRVKDLPSPSDIWITRWSHMSCSYISPFIPTNTMTFSVGVSLSNNVTLGKEIKTDVLRKQNSMWSLINKSRVFSVSSYSFLSVLTMSWYHMKPFVDAELPIWWIAAIP